MSSLVGITVMGITMPMVAQMSIQPFMAQKRAENLGVAEAQAVGYAAANEGGLFLTETPDGCDDPVLLTNGAYSITCTEGVDTPYVQTVTRSFRLQVCDDNDGNNGHGNSGGFDCSNPGGGGYAGNERVFANATPGSFEPHQCPADDPWGVQYTNDQWAKQYGWGACLPGVLWNKGTYLKSNPDDWLYDISDYGFGAHPDY